jgi:hypothetical protein
MKPVSEDQLLVSRKDAARMLGKCVRTIIRFEAQGLLTPVKLNPNPNTKLARVSLRISEIKRLAEGSPVETE